MYLLLLLVEKVINFNSIIKQQEQHPLAHFDANPVLLFIIIIFRSIFREKFVTEF